MAAAKLPCDHIDTSPQLRVLVGGGVDAERKADLLSPAIRALLTTDRVAPPWVLGGWLRTHWAGDDVSAAATWIRELAARLAL